MKPTADIIRAVEGSMINQFQTYTFLDMINDTPDLTDEEKHWAKQHLDYGVKEI